MNNYDKTLILSLFCSDISTLEVSALYPEDRTCFGPETSVFNFQHGYVQKK